MSRGPYREPRYIEVAEAYKSAIRAGILPYAKPIPSLSEMAIMHNISIAQASRARRVLVIDGFVRKGFGRTPAIVAWKPGSNG